MDKKQHISKLRDRQEGSDQSLLSALAGAINRLEKAFPEQWHFLMEFIQNADDSNSEKFSLRVRRDSVTILNDGKPFDYADVESICNVGQSSKARPDHGEEYIGYLGVGFKSVFLISDNPQIYSGDYQFEFDKYAWEQPDMVPWQITPMWIDQPQVSVPDGYTTKFEIPIGENITDSTFEKLKGELQTEQISDRTLLFLNNLEEIEIKDDKSGKRKSIKKTKQLNTDEYAITDVRVRSDGDEWTNRWLLYSATAEVPNHVRDDPMTKRWERDEIHTREVMVAFNVDKGGRLLSEEGTAHIGVFSFLPLKEVPSGLDFLIQADFLTAPGRETIHRDAPWNRWLASEVFNLITETVIPSFKNDERWRHIFTKFLYPSTGGHSLFDQEIHKPLQEYLKSNEVVLTTDGNFAVARQCVSVEPNVRSLLSIEDFQELYPDHSMVHERCEVPYGLEKQMASGPSYSSTKGLLDGMSDLLRLNADQKEPEFFERLYVQFAQWSTSTASGSKIRHEPVVLTENYTLCTPTEASLRTEADIPAEISDEFTFVHPEINNPEALEALDSLGVEMVTQRIVDKRLNMNKSTKEAKSSGSGGNELANHQHSGPPTINSILDLEHWSDLSTEERIQNTRDAVELYHSQDLPIEDFGPLEVLTTSGTWVSPESVLFSQAYRPNHNLEQLDEEGLIPTSTVFLSSDYVSQEMDYTPREWREFFGLLDVEEDVNESSLIEQIAVESALRIEANKGRSATPLPRHEEVEGYDIESGQRFIEVKGSKKSDPTVALSRQQFRRLKEDQDRYYLYIVRNALDRPEVAIIEGKNILDVDRSVRVSYSELRGLSESEHSIF
jgi:hypothetical protein